MKSRQNKVVISFDQTELSGEFLLFRERLDEHNKSDQPWVCRPQQSTTQKMSSWAYFHGYNGDKF